MPNVRYPMSSGLVLRLAHQFGPWQRQPNGVITNPKGFTPLEAVAHDLLVGLGLRHAHATTTPDTCWLLPKTERELLERAATVRPPFGEADLEAAGVVRARITMLTWCGWRTWPERWSLEYDRWLGPPTGPVRMVIEGVGIVVLFGILFVVYAVMGE